MFENEYDPTQYDKTLNEIEVAKQDRAEFEAINQVALFDEYLGNKTTNWKFRKGPDTADPAA